MVGFPRRILESVALPILLSALCMLARKASLIPGAVVAGGLCIVAILFVNYLNMTDHLFAVRREDVFYKTNFAVFGINFVYSIVLSVINVFVDMGEAYTLFCLPYEIFSFLGMPLILSALIVNAIFALEIFIMPYIAVKRRR